MTSSNRMADEKKPPAPEDSSDLDLGIVSDTFRSMTDQAALDSLIERWNQKLNALDDEPSALERHLSAAFFKQMDLAEETLERLDIQIYENPLKRVVSEVAGPAIVLSADLRVASVNSEGAERFGASAGGFLSPGCIAPECRADFSTLLRSAEDRGNMAHTVLRILDPATGAHGFRAEAFLFHLPKQTKPYIAIRTLELAWSPETTEQLVQAFGLTEAEVTVGRQFFETCDLTRVAAERGVSLHTVRTQMKAVLGKTGAHSQADLIRLFAMVASRQMLGNRGLSSKWQDPLKREEILTLPSGRKIAWTWMGAQSGTPAVLLRGMAMGYLLPAEAERMLKRAGIRLLLPSRPGYGNSSLHQDLPALEDNRVLLHDFMAEMQIKGCVGIGMSDGIIPLLAEQDRHPDRFRALVSVGFNGCLNRAAFRKLPVPQATLLRLAKSAPRLLELIAKLGERMIQRYGVDWYLDRAHASTPIDLQTCRDPATATLVRDACAHLIFQGPRTFVRDMQMFHAPVDRAIDRLTVPMLSMVPTEDMLFELSEYKALERRNPLVEVVPVENTADLLIYQRTEFIMGRIIDVILRHR